MQHVCFPQSHFKAISPNGEIHSMIRVDPDRNMHRFYRIRILPDLFAPASLCVAWGRIGRPERLRVEASGNISDLQKIAEKIAMRKYKKGYEEDLASK